MNLEIGLYSGDGASEKCLEQLKYVLKKYFNAEYYCVNKLNIEKFLHTNAKLLIIGGGRDKLYCKDLNGKINNQIKKFVYDGGNYLGICAGSYYASSSIEFARGTSDEIIEERELSFYDGKVIGPVFGPYFYKSINGARASLLDLDEEYFNFCQTKIHYNGGGYFYDTKKIKNYKILAYYSDIDPIQPAIIKINYGKGIVILSGVHFEFFDPLNSDFNSKKNIIELEKYKNINLEVFIKIFKEFQIKQY